MTTVGLIAPGAMGASVGAAIRHAEVVWASEGRSSATRSRAETAGLRDVGSLGRLVEVSDVIVSVCPPHAAVETARAVAAEGFSGCVVDANAISPATAREVRDTVAPAAFADGGIIGPPAHQAGTTRLYLSGGRAAEVAALFDGGPLDVRVLDSHDVAASAIKMAFAAWTKGSSALLLAVCALAEAEGVADDLRAEWAESLPDLADRAERTARRAGPKAWRFAGEMAEIADTFTADGLPDGFHRAAAETYAALEAFKDAEAAPGLADVIAALRARGAGYSTSPRTSASNPADSAAVPPSR